MSKKILIDEILLDRIIGDLALSEKVAPIWQEQYRYMSDILDLKVAIEKSNSGCYSVLEWHPMSEKPKDLSDILVRDTNGAIFDSFAYYYENDWLIHRGDKAQIVEWAYLPE